MQGNFSLIKRVLYKWGKIKRPINAFPFLGFATANFEPINREVCPIYLHGVGEPSPEQTSHLRQVPGVYRFIHQLRLFTI